MTPIAHCQDSTVKFSILRYTLYSTYSLQFYRCWTRDKVVVVEDHHHRDNDHNPLVYNNLLSWGWWQIVDHFLMQYNSQSLSLSEEQPLHQVVMTDYLQETCEKTVVGHMIWLCACVHMCVCVCACAQVCVHVLHNSSIALWNWLCY